MPGKKRIFISSVQKKLATERRDLWDYLEPLAAAGWLERTIPDKPTSPNQRYRLTAMGRTWLAGTKS